ncbi:protein Iojap, chloroplastic [Thrips palmi]|uniref:Mitochondrial assembly of ribosomal large subunit protein 1 n=1 Tax=Thrips palmi TaxID=161013 RepID=A0A6P8Y247_THRPL|nr:protein Iojap, chloroplastic [Thrips palmi]
MFAKTHLLRILSDTSRLINRPSYVLNLAASEQHSRATLSGFTRCFSKDNNKPFKEGKTAKENNISNDDEVIEIFDVEEEKKKFASSGNLTSKYKVFKDEDSPIILDVEEERLVSRSVNETHVTQQNEFDAISFKPGVHGVFDIDELVSILKSKNAEDIVVIQMDSTTNLAQQMVIVTGKSSRHLKALASFVRLVYKKKIGKHDLVPHVEGKSNKSDNWFALDLGNIILHLFSKHTRAVYDLESLWALGPEFDPFLNEAEDPLAAIISKHSHYISDLEPADAK